MSRFNKKSETTLTTNKAGGVAYQQSPKLELVSLMFTSFINNKFYETADESLKRLQTLARNIDDKLFLAKAAVYARDKFNMRSTSHVIAGEVVANVKNEAWVKQFIQRVAYRVDDLTEIWSYYLFNFAKQNKKGHFRPIPNCLKKGTILAINENFDEYQLAKYKGKNKQVSLADIVNLSLGIKGKTKPIEDKNNTKIGKIITDTLSTAKTWESEKSKIGQQKDLSEDQKKEALKETWTDLIKNRKLGYKAALNNLVKISEEAPECLDDVLKYITNPKAVQNSKLFPFRFYIASKVISKMNLDSNHKKRIFNALSKAADLSLANVPKLEGKTLIALDCSASMTWTTIGKPKSERHKESNAVDLNACEVGGLFASALYKNNDDADVILFDSNAKYFSTSTTKDVISIAQSMVFNGGATCFASIFNSADKAYDRIIILSDMESWVGGTRSSYKKYKDKYNCHPKMYCVDLSNYGTMQFPENNVFCIAGWSQHIFDIMEMCEADKNAMIHEIEKVTFEPIKDKK